MSDRLEGITSIITYMDLSRSEFYRDHYQGLKPYLLTRDHPHRRKNKYKIYTFKALVRAYLLKLEIKKNS